MPTVAPVIQFTEAQRAELERVVCATISSRDQFLRASIVLLAAQGHPGDEITGTLGIPPQTVG